MTNFNLIAADWRKKFLKNNVRKLNDFNLRGKSVFFKTEQFNNTCKILSAEDARSSIPKSSECVHYYFQTNVGRSSFFKMGTRGQ